MTVVVDAKKRVVLPSVKAGDRFDVRSGGEGKLVLTRLEPIQTRRARVRIEKRGRFSVGVVSRSINEQALRDALAEFP